MRTTPKAVAALAVGICAGVLLGVSGAWAHAPAPDDACQPPANEFNHLKCYKIKDTSALKGGIQVDLFTHEIAQGFIDEHCETKPVKKLKATKLCVDVKKESASFPPSPTDTDLGAIPNAWDYLCYSIKCKEKVPDTLKKDGLSVKDQFGERRVFVKKAFELCVPLEAKGTTTTTTSSTTILTSSSTTSTSSTTTPTSSSTTTTLVTKACTDTFFPNCAGDCPTGEICTVVTGSDNCACQPVPCGPQPGGTCGGTCVNALDVCVFASTGQCDCVPPDALCESQMSGFGLCTGGICPPNEVCDDDGAGLPCRCFPTLACDVVSTPTCNGVCGVGQTCVHDPAVGTTCVCQ